MSAGHPFAHPTFLIYVFGRAGSTIAVQIMSVAVGWEVYGLTHRPLDLGLVGLAQFLPMFLFTLPGGDTADRYDRRLVLSLSYIAQALSAFILLAFALIGTKAVWPFYAALALFGAARAFAGPASSSILARLVPIEIFTQATTIASSAFQMAVIVGPAIGGVLFALGPAAVFATSAVLFVLVAGTSQMLTLRGENATVPRGDQTALARAVAGIQFVWKTPIVLGAISLDLFAVLLGGATALLPVYASDILHTGPTGLGLLRAAPALGAACIGIFLAGRPIEQQTGPLMFGCVALFGAATIVFGLSTNMILSLAALIVLGASDMVSVIIRWTLVQLATPDEMRGRVSAFNLLFVGASNELGEFESGFTAALFGTIPAVVLGGIGTIAVVGIWMALFPGLRTLDRPTDVAVKEAVA